MFDVEWVINRGKNPPGVVAREASQSENLAAVIAFAKSRLGKVRAMHPKTPPNGFVIHDSAGKEVSRWFRVDHHKP